jgi:hypothetical protein
MFRITGPVLSSKELEPVKFATAKKAKFPAFPKDGPWSHETWEKVRAAWEAFTGPVKNPEHFIFCVDFSDTLYTVIEFNKGVITVELADEDALDEVEELLPLTKPVAQLSAQARQPPNAPCRCGSNRKAKKCCG